MLRTNIRDMESTAHPSLTAQAPGMAVRHRVIGLIASTLTVEKFELAEILPTSRPARSESFTCGSVMISEQAAAFGIPNPLLGTSGFSVVMAIGVLILTGAARRAGSTAFVIGLGPFPSSPGWPTTRYSIHALCIYCMVVGRDHHHVLLRSAFHGDAADPPRPGLACARDAEHVAVPDPHRVVVLIAALIIIESGPSSRPAPTRPAQKRLHPPATTPRRPPATGGHYPQAADTPAICRSSRSTRDSVIDAI